MGILQNCAGQSSYDTTKAHHTKNGFKNIYPFKSPSLFDFLKWQIDQMSMDIPPVESYRFPVADNNPDFLKRNLDQISLTWIGHATVLLQIAGINILTDPHFSERASMVQWAGPKRAVRPGLSIDSLPPIDWVLVSHNHYDHLDKNSVVQLSQLSQERNTVFMVPLGLKQWFTDLGIDDVLELDWWEQHSKDEVVIYSVPVQHWSKRSPFKQNESLWAGWVMHTEAFRFFFAGDTGYSPIFSEIGKRLGPFDLCAVPIGSYEPRWMMKNQHVSPEEALKIHKDAQCKKSVGIHWGTFILTDERLDEPPKQIRKLGPKMGVSNSEFLVLKHGETILLPNDKQSNTKPVP